MRVFPSYRRTHAFLRRKIPLCAFRVTVSRRRRQELEHQLHTAQQFGRLHEVTCLLAILAITDGHSGDDVALTLRITPTSVHPWVRRWLVEGLPGLQWHNPPGRPPKLTKTQQHAVAQLLEEGPVKAGFTSACWRSPMIQPLLYERFGVFSNVFYRAQLRKPLGFSYQKAACIADHLNEGTSGMVHYHLAPDSHMGESEQGLAVVW